LPSPGAARLIDLITALRGCWSTNSNQLICRFAGSRLNGLVDVSKIRLSLCRILAGSRFATVASCRFIGILAGMAYIDPTIDTAETIDHVRRTAFQRSGSRPVGKLRRPAPESQKARTRASGRLRTAVYRCKLDTKRKPESSVVGMALLAAVVTQTSLKSFDAASVSIVTAAFADLEQRGYARSEIEAVFRRIRKMLVSQPDFVSNEK
jgi:hypothetical protein